MPISVTFEGLSIKSFICVGILLNVNVPNASAASLSVDCASTSVVTGEDKPLMHADVNGFALNMTFGEFRLVLKQIEANDLFVRWYFDDGNNGINQFYIDRITGEYRVYHGLNLAHLNIISKGSCKKAAALKPVL